MDYRQARERMRRGEIHSLYLFSGPEEYLKEELLQELVVNLKARGKGECSLEKIDAASLEKGLSSFIHDLRQATIQTSLLAERRILWIYNSSLFSPPKKKDASPANAKTGQGQREKEISALLEVGFTGVTLIFSVEQVDRRKKLVKLMENGGKLVEFPVLKGAALLRWLKDRLAREKIRIADDAALELLERAGENLTLLNNEVEKISTYLQGEEKNVPAELIRLLVPGSSQGNIFQLTDALGKKNMDEALAHLSRLTARSEHPLVILAMIGRHFRLLLQLRTLQEKNYPRREILNTLKIQPFLLDKLHEQVKNYTRPALAGILRDLKETDIKIKSGRVEAADALEQTILRLTVL